MYNITPELQFTVYTVYIVVVGVSFIYRECLFIIIIIIIIIFI